VIKLNENGLACSTHGKDKSAYNILLGMLERKRPLGGPRLI